MTIIFRIQYHTTWGESLHVLIDEKTTVELSTTNGYDWQGEIDYHLDTPASFLTYRYEVHRDNHCIRKEFGALPHILRIANRSDNHYLVKDTWRDLPAASYRFSSAFCGTHEEQAGNQLQADSDTCILFRALCPSGGKTKRILGISGDCKALGSWKTDSPLRMHEIKPNVWQVTVEASKLPPSFTYKYVTISSEDDSVNEWEAHDNRYIAPPSLQPGETYVTPEEEVFFASENYKIAGCAIPVFSLRSEGSYGVGDFGDLKTFIRWAADTHQRAVQVLPINDTTMTGSWTDSYPYSSISIYAFHPMYVDLRQLPTLNDAAAAAEFEQKRIELNALPQVDYEAVNHWKRTYLKAVFHQEQEAVLTSEAFQAFYNNNIDWLQPYAAFCYLRDKYGTPDFHRWQTYSTYRTELTEQLCTPGNEAYPETMFHCYVQYLLHIQLLDACDYGRQLGVIVKGDIPIGISRTSVEAWVEPYYFNMNGQAGAPPDAFSTKGQNWGMPTYNWKVMEQDGYQWWQRRFRKMADYFTAYRIDHILGFFRIWEIPIHSVHGLLGQFVPSLPMSVAEIESYGLHFQKDFMTRPFINDEMLDCMFGERSQEVKDTFVQHLHHDIYEMRPEFDTQRKIEAYFTGKSDTETNNLKEGLYALVSDVLFIPDRDNAEMYHPRIAVQNDFVYRRLNQQEKDAFNRLYNDYYYRRHNEFWYQEAMKKLPILTQATSMLVCGEDLGMVPDCVPWVMEQLQILSLEIQRMPKNPQDEFGHVYAYPFRSVCTIGTHDMSTFRGWWEEDCDVAARFFYHELGHWGNLPEHAPGWLCEDVIRRHLYSPSMLCILTWQDWLSMDENLRNPDIAIERINVPANPRHYWRWRMHLTLEELMKQKDFNDKVRQMIDESGR